MIYIDQTGETYQDLWDLFGSYLQHEDEYTAVPRLQDLTSELFPDIDPYACGFDYIVYREKEDDRYVTYHDFTFDDTQFKKHYPEWFI